MSADNKISVLMGIYNCAQTLEQAVHSIQAQTYTNWELILCDDGSTDSTYQIAARLAMADERIILLKNEKNLGLNYTLNHCLSHATGSYIARMDGDDDCVPCRFEKQLAFLESQDSFAIVSTPMIFFDEHGEWGQTTAKAFPTKEDVVCGSPICHAPVMMRKECMDTVNGYTVDSRLLRVEDVDLWIRLYAAGYRCCNLDEPLYKMRNDKTALKRRKYKYRINSTYARLRGCSLLHLGPLCYIKAFRPMLIGLVPAQMRDFLRRKRSCS